MHATLSASQDASWTGMFGANHGLARREAVSTGDGWHFDDLFHYKSSDVHDFTWAHRTFASVIRPEDHSHLQLSFVPESDRRRRGMHGIKLPRTGSNLDPKRIAVQLECCHVLELESLS